MSKVFSLSPDEEYSMRFIDFFSGIGGERRGMELAGHECVGFCEFDKYARATYLTMHCMTQEQREYIGSLSKPQRLKEIWNNEEKYANGEWYSTDITRLCARDIPRAECWIFSAPCQSFSMSGKREGLDGESGLVREIFRLLDATEEEDRPEWLIYENVMGMLSSSKGFDFLWILREMDRGGYDIEWQLFNSRHYGVPQNRERVYTVGHFRRYGERKIFPVTGTNGEDNLSIKQIGQLRSERNNPDKYRVYDPEGIAPTVSTGSGGGRIPFVTENIHVIGNRPSGGIHRSRVIATDSVHPALSAIDYKQPVSVAIPLDVSGYEVSEGEDVHCLNANDQRKVFGAKQKRTLVGVPIKEATVRGYSVAQEGDAINFSVPNSKTRRGRVGHGVAQTLDTACNQGILVNVSGKEVYAVPYNGRYIAIRRLTPRECFRLQGWEDEYFERADMLLSDSKLYKVCGNGITVTVMEAIGTALDTLGKENPSLKV